MGNTYIRPPKDSLRQAGYQEGDFVPLLTIGAESAGNSTTSASYVEAADTSHEARLVWDTLIPQTATTQFVGFVRVDPSTDQIDVRLRNSVDGETVFEQLGITGAVQDISFSPTDYTPTTTTSESRYVWEIRNADGATSVTLSDPTTIIGVQL